MAVAASRGARPRAAAGTGERLRAAAGSAHGLALGLIVTAGIVVRALGVNVAMRYDEAYSFSTYAILPVRQIVASYNLPNNHVLNSVLMHEAWQQLGNHPWALRVPALLAGCAIVPLAYLAARALYGRHAALWAAALAASSAPLVDFSVNARGYTIGIALVLLALWCGALALERPRPWAWAVFAAASAVAVWSVPTMGPGVAAVGLWLAAVAILRRDFRRVAELALASALAGLGAYLLYRPTIGEHGWAAAKEVPRDWDSLRALASGVWENWNRATPLLLELVIATGFAVGLVAHRRLAQHPLPVAAASLVVMAAALAVGIGVGLFPRYWLVWLPFYLLTAGAGLAWMTDRAAERVGAVNRLAPALPAALAVVLAALLLAAGPRGSEERPQSDARIAEYLRDELKPGEVGMDPVRFARR